ncbi:ankyrin repeat domain-containing protein, partial [Planctomycetota bacterium]
VEECGCDLPPWLPQLLDDTAEKLHLRQMPQVVLSSTVNCPAVLGLFRPVLLLPATSMERLSQQDVGHILLHELAHIKRRDLPVHAVCVLLQIVYWFNPLLILVRRQLQRLREMCCDATVAGILRDKTEAYSQTILRTVEWLVNGPSCHGIGLLGLIEDPHHLRVRLEWLKRKPSRHPSLRIATALILVVTMFAFILPMAKAQTSGANTKPVTLENTDRSTQSLYRAAATGDVEQVKLLISQGADVNALGPHGKTPLLRALTRDDTQAVKVMLENGAQVDAGDSGGWTPLLYAVSRNNEEAVRLIISYGADVNSPPNAKDFPPLFEAVWNGHAGIVKALIDGGANVNARQDGNGWIPLRHALQGVDTDVARQFIDTGVKVPVLHNLVLAGNLAKIRECVEGGMDVDTKDEFGWTPTYWALSMRQKEVAEYLLDRGASITAKTKSGHTLLHQASKAGLTDIVKSLIVKGVEVDAKSDSGDTSLKDAAGAGQESVVRLLIANGAGVNVTAKNGSFPLGDAVDKGHEDVVRLLIANGAEINLETTAGTAINRAAYRGHGTILDLLIVGGADINLNVNGTPLYWAANGRQGVDEEQLVKIVKKLLIKGADVNLREPRQGRTPLHAAALRGRAKVTELLRKHGATEKQKTEPSSLATVSMTDSNSTDDTTVSGLDELQGTWVGHVLGRERRGELKWTFSGNSFHCTGTAGWFKGTFMVNEELVPKQVDLTVTESPPARLVGRTLKCIYELKNRILTLASPRLDVETRRSDFEPSGLGRVWELKRQLSNQEKQEDAEQ